jgi:hypothetical protein
MTVSPEAIGTITLTIETAVNSVRVAFTVPTGTDTVSISRTGPSGVPATVRGWSGHAATAGQALAVRDFEAPIGVPLVYTVTAWPAATPASTQTGTASITVPDNGCGDTWLTDLARPTNTQKIVVAALDELAYVVPVGVHDVIDRRTPITSSGIANTPTFELDFLTVTEDERERARATLGNGIPILLRTPALNGIGNLYMAVTGWQEQRIVKPARTQDRQFRVNAVQVDRPDPILYAPIPPATYQTVNTTFATYAALNAGRPSYDAVLYDYSTLGAADVQPWPPTDV